MEYQGRAEIDKALLAELLATTDELQDLVVRLDPP